MKTRGFSIVELMLTLVLFGLLVTAVVPSSAKATQDARRRSMVRQFISAQSLTKATALAYRQVAELHIDASAGTWWVEVDTSLSATAKDTVGPVRRIRGKNLTMTSNLTLLCFDARGLPTAEGACEAGPLRVTFSSHGETDSVTTTALGKVIR